MTTPFVAGLDARLRALGLSRYKLAQLSGLHENTINGWWHSTATPSMESLSRIAPHLGMSQDELLEMAGYDTVDAHEGERVQEMNVLQQDVLRRCQNMVDVAEMLEALPEDEWRPRLERILDRTEGEIRDAVTLLVRAHLPLETPPPNSNGTQAPRLRPRSLTQRKRVLRQRRGASPNGSYGDLPRGCAGLRVGRTSSTYHVRGEWKGESYGGRGGSARPGDLWSWGSGAAEQKRDAGRAVLHSALSLGTGQPAAPA